MYYWKIFVSFYWLFFSPHNHYTYTVYEIPSALEVGERKKVLSSSRWTGTYDFPKSSTPIVLRTLKIKNVQQKIEDIWSWGMESTWPFVSAASSCHCKQSLTAVGYTTCLWRTHFTPEIRKGFLVASFPIVWTSKLFGSSFYLWQFSLLEFIVVCGGLYWYKNR